MAESNMERCGQAAWLLGLLGAGIWMPVVSWALLMAGDVTGGIVGTGWFGACMGMAWFLAPWRNKTTPLWKPLLLCFGSILGGAVFFTVRYRLYEVGGRHFLWSMLALTAMFLPAFLVGKKTWSQLFPRSSTNEEE
jgi:hypothetical protein